MAAHPSAVVDFRLRLAELLLLENREAEAFAATRSAREAGLATSALSMIEARLKLAHGDAGGAAEAARTALTLAPGRAGSHDFHARALLQAGDNTSGR